MLDRRDRHAPFAPRRWALTGGVLMVLAIVGGLLLPWNEQHPWQATWLPPIRADIVVYGGTPSAVIAAVAASRLGARVIIVDPTDTLGGMASSGLSLTDVRDRGLVRGLPGELFAQVVSAEGDDPSGLASRWAFEPHVVEAAYRSMAEAAHISVLYDHPLRETQGVLVEGGRISALVTQDGLTIRGRVFIDASYEGDLMAHARVAYTWGREPRATYGESQAGIRPLPDASVKGVSGFAADGSLLPGVSAEPHGTPGDGDWNVQPYNYRLCVSSDPANQVSFPMPDGYDPAEYELLSAPAKGARSREQGRRTRRVFINAV